MKLIVGLGNIGSEYNKTRHNVGFMAIDKLCEYYHIELNRHKFSGFYGEKIIDGEKVIFLKPEKYMNLSGEVIADFVNFYKIPVEDIFILHDDLDLPMGKFKLKYKGSPGGHNGLKNIELHLHTNVYKRMKIGISNNKSLDTKDYVLGKFTKEELEILDSILTKVPFIVSDFLTKDFDLVMNKYNGNGT